MSAVPRDETNDPAHRSWVESANRPGDFPIQNLPFAVFRVRDSGTPFRGGVAIGDHILDLAALAATCVLSGSAAVGIEAAARPTLNEFMAMGPARWRALRHALFHGLRRDSPLRPAFEPCLVPQSAAEYAVPAVIGDYTDFYTSIYHATAVGRLFRPDQPLLPNYKWVPIGYHGRSSSIVMSGHDVQRPRGQRLLPGRQEPDVGASLKLDYELELGIFIGPGNALGTSIPVDSAESQVFGLCLLNDWSARDLQAWEYQPLGPFLAKNFATTLSPWIVPLQALAPFRTPLERPAGDPQPVGYLASIGTAAGIDIRLEALLQTRAMHDRGEPPQRLSVTSFRHCYWSIAQLIAHHSVNGCNLRPGDLLGTGTQSGPGAGEAGSLLELSAGGRVPVSVGSREQRAFLEDGDRVTFRAWCDGDGATRIGFGEMTGGILPASQEALT